MPLFLREFDPDPEELTQACLGSLHPMAEEGIRLFDAREYWHAHEALEEAWIETETIERALYKGILQAGVLYLHIERENLIGALKMYERSKVWLTPWPAHCRTVDVGQLREDIWMAVKLVRELGPDRLGEFDERLFKPIVRV